MTVIKAVYKVLDSLYEGQQFTGAELHGWSRTYATDKYFYISTVLRAMRRWRSLNSQVKCINNHKSIYKMTGAKQ